MSTDSMSKAELGNRKARHLEICTGPAKYQVEGTTGTGFEQLQFLHNALPELSWEELDPTVSFLGYRVSLPLFISCMTGGSAGGRQANRLLAEAAQQAGIPVGMGSIRILFHDPQLFSDFNLKEVAPDVPVLGNLGAVQLRDLELAAVLETIKKLQIDAMVIHLNPGQELFQRLGDRDFRGLKDAIARLCERCTVPVIVKETGFGIRPSQVRELLALGVAFVDLAGAGGTNWIQVESYLGLEEAAGAEEFRGWGIPTAYLLAALGDLRGRILASGGIRTGLDLAKAIALGAELGGAALPFIRAAAQGGVEAVLQKVQEIGKTFKAAMLLTGSRTVAALRSAPLWRHSAFDTAVETLKRADGSGGAEE